MIRFLTAALYLGITLLPFLVSAQDVGTYYEQSGVRFESINWSADGTIYTADYGAGKLYKLTPDGTLTEIASGFQNLAGGGFDADGNYYFSDIAGGGIYKVNADDSYDLVAGGFNQPVGIAAHPDSNFIYIVSYGNNTVKKIDLPSGNVRGFVTGGGLNGPDGIVMAPNGDLIVANFNNNRLWRITPSGDISEFARHPGGGYMGYVARAGDYYYAPSIVSHTLARFSEDGIAESFAGTGQAGYVDGPADMARFNQPNGIASNQAGDTLLLTENERIRFVTNLEGVASSDHSPQNWQQDSVYPVPFSNYLTVEYTAAENGNFKMELFDLQGRSQKVFHLAKNSNTQNSYQLELREIPIGTYILQISEDGTVRKSIQVVKQ